MKKIILIFVLFTVFGCTGKTVNISTDNENDSLWNKSYFNNELFENNLILENNFSISFWYKSDENKLGSDIFTLGDEENFIKLTSSGYNDAVYSGLTLYDDNNNWVIADGNKTVKTGRFNYIAVNINNKVASVFLNGELVATGNIKNDIGKNFVITGKAYYSDFIITNTELKKEKVIEEYNNKLPMVLLDTIKIAESDDMINDFWLDGYEIEGYPVKWVSSNQEVIDFRGVIVNKDVSEDTVVTLNATIDINGKTADKDFEVIVRKNDENRKLIRDTKTVSNYLDRVMFSQTELPTVLNNGSVVNWSVSGKAYIENNQLIKIGDSRELVTLTADISNGEFHEIKSYEILLLDKIGGYIMSYFNGELEEEKGNLAFSYDGINWEKLNVDITSNKGTGRIRDPFISRDKNGNFVIVATEGFDNPNIYVFRSNYLLDFDENELVQVTYFDEGLRMSGNRAWAPEFTYDLESNKYYMYFSDNGFVDKKYSGGSIYATVSDDLMEFSYPFIYFNPGYSVIDGHIVKANGYNYLFYKDERKASQSIFYAESDSLKGFNKAYDEKFLNLNKYMEGPFTFKDKNGGYFIYMDNYPNETFYVGHFNFLGKDNDIVWLDEFTLPEDIVRHGSVVLVSERELEEILKLYK